MLIIILLLASKVLLITGYHELHEIEALKLKIEKLENVTQTQNEKIASLNEQLQQGLEKHDLEIDMMKNESNGQQEQLENLQEYLEEHDNKTDAMLHASNIQERHLKYLDVRIRRLRYTDYRLLQTQDELNAKLQNATNELNAKIQNKSELTHNFTEKYNNMQKDIQKNHNDINKLNRGLITYRTWGTHCKFERIWVFILISDRASENI